MTHICVGNQTISGYLNQWWNIVNWTHWNKLQWILIIIQTASFKNMHLKMSSGKWRPSWVCVASQYLWSNGCQWTTLSTLLMCRVLPATLVNQQRICAFDFLWNLNSFTDTDGKYTKMQFQASTVFGQSLSKQPVGSHIYTEVQNRKHMAAMSLRKMFQ